MDKVSNEKVLAEVEEDNMYSERLFCFKCQT